MKTDKPRVWCVDGHEAHLLDDYTDKSEAIKMGKNFFCVDLSDYDFAVEQLEQALKNSQQQTKDYANEIDRQLLIKQALEQKLAAQEAEIDLYKNANIRTIDAAYHALLEMSAWLGINPAKRDSYIEELMSNVRFCADIKNQHLTKKDE